MSRNRPIFWSEAVFSQAGTVIPARVRRGNAAVKWSISAIVGELLRETGHCGHVEKPMPPVPVFGLPPNRLREREAELGRLALGVEETYERKGKVFKRRQKSSTPTLLMAVASWPSTSINADEMRDRWERRVVRAAKARWGSAFKGAYAHTDEAHYHLHLWVDDDGRPVKQLHAGFGAVQSLPPGSSPAQRSAAYKAGARLALDWYHDRVGRQFGMPRVGAHPRPRMTRAGALRARQEALEVAEDQVAADKRSLAQARDKVLEHTAMLKEAYARLQAREAKLRAKAEALAELRSAVEDQLEVEERVRRNRYSVDVDLFS